MKKAKYILVALVLVALTALVVIFFAFSRDERSDVTVHGLLALPGSPLDATYEIEGHELVFTSGKAEVVEDDVVFTVKGEPVYGDVNGDGLDDAVLLVVSEKDGEEKIQYITLALKDSEGGYMGMNGVATDPARTLQEFTVQDEMVVVTYEEETNNAGGPHEYLTLTHVTLQKFTPENEDDVVAGTLTFMGDTPEITLCDSGGTYTVSSESNSLAALRAIYTERSNTTGSDSVYMVVSGATRSVVETEGSDVGEEPTDTPPQEEEVPTNTSEFLIRAVLSAPKEGVCTSVPTEQVSTSDTDEETTKLGEGEEVVVPETVQETPREQE